MKFLFSLLVACSVLIAPIASFGRCGSGSRFRAGHGSFTACDGSTFIPRGANLQYGDSPAATLPAFAEMAKTNMNIVRIELRSYLTGKQIQDALEACLGNGMVPMVMLWDSTTTCGSGISDMQKMVQLYGTPDWRSVLQNERYAPYLIVNVLNEFSAMGGMNRTQYRDAMKWIVGTMRGYGYTSPLVLDAYHCGQVPDTFSYVNPDTQQRTGDELLKSDPLGNLMFAYHAYSWLWDQSDALAGHLKDINNLAYPWLMTEHGNSYLQSEKIDHNLLWKTTWEMNSGVLSWAWGGGHDALDISSKNYPYTPTAYGHEIVDGPYGTRNTAKRCNCLQ
jgi:mannan endo-1,4-beta-mannosidase